MTKMFNKRIALFIPTLGGGGAERVMVLLANSLTDRGFVVDLVLVSVVGPYLAEVSPSVNLVDLRKNRVITCLPGLVKYLYQSRPITLLSFMSHANLIALLANWLAGGKTRVVVSERTHLGADPDLHKNFISLIILFLNRRLYLRADAIHAVSEGVADSVVKMLKLPREKIKVVYNPVVSEEMFKLRQSDDCVSWLPDKSRPMILAAGRLTKAKDFATLIRSFALVRKMLNASLVIMGEGELRTELETLITDYELQEHVLLLGFVDNPFSVMKQADVFVVSSAWEGLSNVLIEAMACGIPVVSTDCPSGPAEILEGGKWGRLVSVGDVESLAQAIIDTLLETQHPKVASRAAYFSLERSVDGYLSLLLPGLPNF